MRRFATKLFMVLCVSCMCFSTAGAVDIDRASSADTAAIQTESPVLSIEPIAIDNESATRVMPMWYLYEKSHAVTSKIPFGNCEFIVAMNGQTDIQGGNVMDVDLDFRVGHSTNMVDHNVTVDYSIYGESIAYTLEGTVYFEWTNPQTGNTLRNEVPVLIPVNFDTPDYFI